MTQNQAPSPQSSCKTAAIDRPLRGVIVPLVTPLLARDELDVDGLDRLIEHVVLGGVHGIFLLGTTGESAALSGRLRRELVDHVSRGVRGRVPLIVGISDTSLVESLRLAEHAAEAGAAAVVATTPYYLPLEPAELVNYAQAISAESPLPVFLYNMPELTKTWFSLDVLARLLDQENIVGLKDSSGDADYFSAAQRLIARRPDWSILVGSDSMTGSAVRQGGHGSVCGGANVWPKLLVGMYDAALNDDERLIAELQQQIVELGKIYRFGGFAVGSIRGIKTALELLSISSALMASPHTQVSQQQREEIAQQLRRLGLLQDESPDAHIAPVNTRRRSAK